MPSLAAKAKGHPPLADGQRSGLHREQRRVKALPRATTTAWQEEQSRRTNTREWEVDFCSRPIKDERGKRVWEVLATDAERSFEHAEYLPNNRINSGELAAALRRGAEEKGVSMPTRIRFFRPQMQTIISRACNELEATPTPSRRCFTIMAWLEERKKEVYPKEEGYDPSLPPPMDLEKKAPERLPDQLRGEKWAFVGLSLAEVEEECRAVWEGAQFGAVVDLSKLNLDLSHETLVPGVCVYSRRSAALAGWMSGLELANLKAMPEEGQLLLETGVSDLWQYATFRPRNGAPDEARAWEEAKQEASGLHFVAVQPSSDSNVADGFWLMRDFTPDV